MGADVALRVWEQEIKEHFLGNSWGYGMKTSTQCPNSREERRENKTTARQDAKDEVKSSAKEDAFVAERGA